MSKATGKCYEPAIHTELLSEPNMDPPHQRTHHRTYHRTYHESDITILPGNQMTMCKEFVVVPIQAFFGTATGILRLLCKLEVPDPRQELETCGAISSFRELIK
ncbi:MAG: hypothetical protein EA361_01265 [Bacteroidetes bacterium]|nr:MAG: hypothetical protein EA361_01265 [Bacteroidota bacterium]